MNGYKKYVYRKVSQYYSNLSVDNETLDTNRVCEIEKLQNVSSDDGIKAVEMLFGLTQYNPSADTSTDGFKMNNRQENNNSNNELSQH